MILEFLLNWIPIMVLMAEAEVVEAIHMVEEVEAEAQKCALIVTDQVI